MHSMHIKAKVRSILFRFFLDHFCRICEDMQEVR
jgi:hypothetical protein